MTTVDTNAARWVIARELHNPDMLQAFKDADRIIKAIKNEAGSGHSEGAVILPDDRLVRYEKIHDDFLIGSKMLDPALGGHVAVAAVLVSEPA